jgi:nucleobase:cation symporter-1, NCS1 family
VTTSDQSADSAGRTSALIETRSIDYVPDDERHGRVSRQGPFWFVGNFQPFTLALGFVGPSLGLSLGWTIVAGLAGIAFGTLFMAFHATQGPVLGLPQMIQSRAQFGYRGVLLPLVGTCSPSSVSMWWTSSSSNRDCNRSSAGTRSSSPC